MTCVELQESLAEIDDGSGLEQKRHLQTCPACSALLKELDLIVEAASQLQACDEPSPRVWNSIEIALREEGIIRPQPTDRHSGLPSFGVRWGLARWLVPAAAMLLIAVGMYEHKSSSNGHVTQEALVVAPAINAAGLNDEDLLQEVAANTPAMKDQYEVNLQRVNESIRDAQGTVDESPNDEDARRSLMDAYQQKSMLFEMAMGQQQ